MFYWLRFAILIFTDGILINLSVYLALWLRFEGHIPPATMEAAVAFMPWGTVITMITLYFFRLYHSMWEYASLDEMLGIIKAVFSASALLFIVNYTMPFQNLPRSVYILSALIAILAIGGTRLGWRIFRDAAMVKQNSDSKKRVLIVGAGDAGALLARELQHNTTLNLTPVGFIDDRRSKQNLSIYGIPILGNRRDISQVVSTYHIDEIIIAIPSANGRTIREILDICRTTSARTRIFQGADTMLKATPVIRDIKVEDLLRREPVTLRQDEISAYLQDKSVMVTGAGGSIGSELCRQICACSPQSLILLEYSENNLFEIQQELLTSYPDMTLYPELVDVRERYNLEGVFRRRRPQVIFHAAAYKHVPLMEENPAEAVRNNVIGSRNVAELAHQYGSESFILISTDKAVYPSSVMGATKRIAELIIQELGQHSPTRFAAVRFGNVLGSRGSVLPIFEKQIARGEPVTITHPEMTRYFMTIPEAAQLVIQAGAMANQRELFVLDMGEPVKIMDLARDLILLHGLVPERDVPIQVTGMRPGEKLHEELFSGRERRAATQHNRIFVCETAWINEPGILRTIDDLLAGDYMTSDYARMFIKTVLARAEELKQAQRSADEVG